MGTPGMCAAAATALAMSAAAGVVFRNVRSSIGNRRTQQHQGPVNRQFPFPFASSLKHQHPVRSSTSIRLAGVVRWRVPYSKISLHCEFPYASSPPLESSVLDQPPLRTSLSPAFAPLAPAFDRQSASSQFPSARELYSISLHRVRVYICSTFPSTFTVRVHLQRSIIP